MASSIRSKMRCVFFGLMYKTARKRERCVLFMTFRPSQRTLFMARRNWVPLALSDVVLNKCIVHVVINRLSSGDRKRTPKTKTLKIYHLMMLGPEISA